MIKNLFVTPVGIYNEPVSPDLVDSVLRMDNIYNLWELNTNWVRRLKHTIDSRCKEYTTGLFSNYMEKTDPINVEGKVNVQYPGDMFPLHSHSHNHIACVYYLNVPENSGDLLLVDPRGDTNWNDRVDGKFSNVSYERIKPQAGMMIFFPSYISHMVEPNKSDKVRVSVVSNFYMRRYA